MVADNPKFKWVIDDAYRNTGSKNNKNDQLIRKIWVNKDFDLADDEKDWTIQNSGGIRGLSKGDLSGKISGIDKSAVFCFTTKQSTGSHNPWDDATDYFKGEVKYWGDAKYNKSKDIDEWLGNRILKNISDKTIEGNFDEVPPILYFNSNKSGWISFRGLCVIYGYQERSFMDKDHRIKNYQWSFAMLDVQSVDPEWIKHRALNNNDNHKSCPLAWKNYVKNGKIKRLQAWRNNIKSKDSQLPVKRSKEDRFLQSLKEMPYDDFETIICSMLQSSNLVHNIDQTRKTSDGGFDMIGKFFLPDPFHYEINFKGEVKRWAGNSSVGVKDISRLVARLRRGEYGLFFTTSYYGRQAQEEVIKDAYPVKLFSGVDMYNLFEAANMIKEGKLIKK